MNSVPESTRLPITLPTDLHEWLRRTSFEERRSMAELVREAVLEFRAVHEAQLRLPLEEAR
jgi:hypothetical protein